MDKLSEKYNGESPKVTIRMDPGMLRLVDREARRIDGNRSAALRSLVMRATGAGVTAAVSAAATAQKELADAASDDTARNTALRARWKALSIPLRTFVTKHGVTRTPFQKWAAGERDMHVATLGKYEAAIRSEES